MLSGFTPVALDLRCRIPALTSEPLPCFLNHISPSCIDLKHLGSPLAMFNSSQRIRALCAASGQNLEDTLSSCFRLYFSFISCPEVINCWYNPLSRYQGPPPSTCLTLKSTQFYVLSCLLYSCKEITLLLTNLPKGHANLLTY